MSHQVSVMFCALGLSALAALAIGCSSSNSNDTSSNGQVTTISSSRLLKDLSLTELKQLVCQDSGAYMQNQIGTSLMKSGSCTLAAALAGAMGSSVSECQSAYNQCVSSSGGTTTSTCDVTSTVPSTCAASVAEYSTCVTDSTAQMKSYYQQLANLGSQVCTNADAGITSSSATTTPASCQTLASKCPGLSMPGGATNA